MLVLRTVKCCIYYEWECFEAAVANGIAIRIWNNVVFYICKQLERISKSSAVTRLTINEHNTAFVDQVSGSISDEKCDE